LGIRWIIESLSYSKHQPVIATLIMPVMVGAWCAFTLFKGGSVTIGSDFIEGHTLVGRCTFKKRLGREQIKSISENKRGLSVMGRGRFATWMLGFIFIPATVPEYQEIKSILSGWVPIQGGR